MSGQLDRRPFNEAVIRALDRAVERSGSRHPVDTRDVLLALMEGDPYSEWERVWLRFAGPESVASAVVGDPVGEPGAGWGSASLSVTCCAGLALAVRLAEAYGPGPVSIGVATLGLVANPATAAARALTRGDDRRHPALLESVQESIVGGSLNDLDEVLRSEPHEPPRDEGVKEFDAIVADLGGAERLRERDALALLAAAIRQVRDPDLKRRLSLLRLDAIVVESVRPKVAELSGPTAEELVVRAQNRFDTARPDAQQLIVAVTHRACEPVTRALWLLGDPAVGVAFEAAATDAQGRKGPDDVSNSTVGATVLNALISVAATMFIVRAAVHTHHWWLLSFIYIVWTGHPVVTLVAAAALWWAADSVTALTALVLAVVDLVMARTEIRTAMFRTGIRLTIRDLRRHVRLRSARQGVIVTKVVEWHRARRLAGGTS